MSNVYQLPDRERCLDEASEWLARLDRGLDESETRDFQRWLAASRENSDTFMQIAELWDKMDALSRLADLFPPPAEKKPSFGRWLAAAASVLLVLGAALWQAGMLTGSPPASTVNKVYETAIGEHSTVNLPDGSVLVLNTDSLVRVHYTLTSRLIELDRGEINVRVARDRERPLSVLAAGRVVQAVGTAFNVQLRRDRSVELIVTEGRVRVADGQNGGPGGARNEPQPLPATATAVSGGERLLMSGERPQPEQVERIEPAEMDARLSWRSGNLVFRGEPLEQAVAEISRYTSVKFRIEDEQLKGLRVAGLFRTGDIKGLLRTLNDNFDIANERIDEQTVILRARREEQGETR
ncbi:FecR family protein [Microbulbifer rhizosphaerae]|uniref:Transmembrane sensor n=1 Tax=Microbulbifer rhizosphaerae TaxID=1562603 RepID=A0A7W4WB63_9GAMM|nr:FecR domain-containing protein [Microbulbifer rhizosphaerae]MBB3061065.1 transmembrane sensor [Microbulbifer rhizosphaerae]